MIKKTLRNKCHVNFVNDLTIQYNELWNDFTVVFHLIVIVTI